MKFNDYWANQTPQVREWLVSRLGITKPYISLMKHGHRAPSSHLHNLMEIVTGVELEFEAEATEE